MANSSDSKSGKAILLDWLFPLPLLLQTKAPSWNEPRGPLKQSPEMKSGTAPIHRQEASMVTAALLRHAERL